MGKHKIDQEVKDQILSRIKNEGVSVYQASKDHGVSPNTIYKWLDVGLNQPPKKRTHTKRVFDTI